MIYIDEKLIDKISSLVHSYSGICLESSNKRLLEKKIEAQMNLLSITDANDYIFVLEAYKSNSKALDDLATALTTSETYFFRNPNQFNYMLVHLLPDIRALKLPFQPIKIWSLGCSHGEEAYSIAMTAKYFNTVSAGVKFNISAGDLNQNNLQTAKKGVYPKRSVSNHLDSFEQKFGFKCGQRMANGGYTVDSGFKELISFCKVNLNNTESLNYLKGSDIIFCRNVLIYFDFELRKKLFDIFFKSLNAGGALFLGETECVYAGRRDFKAIKYKNAVIYKKVCGLKNE